MSAVFLSTWGNTLTAAAAVGFAEFRATYTVRSWLTGWLVRVVTQVVFYASIGSLLGSDERRVYLLVGASVSAVVTEVALACASASREHRTGRLAMLVATPAPLTAVLIGRSSQWLPSAVLTSSFCVIAVGPLFGLVLGPFTALASIGLLAAAAIGTYCFALFLAVLILYVPAMRYLAGALASAVTFAICGAVVPVAFWPGWVEAVAAALPATHALSGLRTAISGGSGWHVAADAGLAVGVGAVWLALGGLGLRHVVVRGRSDGSVVDS
ncbi:MAG: ABC transporter permease [Stackebrandtia sp.]